MATPQAKTSKITAEQKEKCRLVTPMFRVSYPHIFKAQAIKPTDKPKFSITMLFPKDKDLSALKEAIKQAKIAQFGAKENWPTKLESPVTDGDDPKFKDKEGYKGHWVIKASCNETNRPQLVDYPNKNPITDQADFYAGCYARASIFAYAWEYMGKQGVGFILDHVQKLKDGKPFGGRKPAQDVFAPVGEDLETELEDADVDEDDDNGFM